MLTDDRFCLPQSARSTSRQLPRLARGSSCWTQHSTTGRIRTLMSLSLNVANSLSVPSITLCQRRWRPTWTRSSILRRCRQSFTPSITARKRIPSEQPLLRTWTSSKKAVDQIQEENLELSLNVVTIFYLNQYYEIPDNIGYTTGTQAVFETASEQYSQSDLTAFQQNYNITQQTAEDVNGFETDDCSASSGNCDEGNLDIQYIMVSTFATFPSLPYMFSL
jgi:hypothetical protein